MAGAKSVCVSLWRVDDVSTSHLMSQTYELMEQGHLEYAHALGDAKRRFISGEMGSRFEDPCYWAGFVYFGASDRTVQWDKEKRDLTTHYLAWGGIVLAGVLVACLYAVRARRKK
jgi:hypothetical protein